MSITYPRTDLFTGVKASTLFRLAWRQETSRIAAGAVLVKDLGPPLWTAQVQTAAMTRADVLDFEARINSLEGGDRTFYLHDRRRPYPRAHPDGAFGDTGVISDVGGGGNRLIKISGLDAGFTLSVGDYLAFDYGAARALHQVIEGGSADGAGLTDWIQVEPAIRTGWTAGDAVTLKQPSGLFMIAPGSGATTMVGPGHGSYAFDAVQVLW